jgi:effector-binding domain-containing protein/uncharacterized protein YndB with AHSA1/START domain
MKFLKYALLLILLLVIGSLVFTMMQPSEYDIARTKVIKAPVADVFNTVNDLKTWEEWGPWHDEDSTIVVTYGETTVGVGASDSWTSKDGPGNIKTVAVEVNKSIHQKMQFGDYEPTDIVWDFKEVDGGTEITWHIKETNAPFMFKMFAAMSGGWDKMLGPMEAQGLDNLDKVIQKKMQLENSYSISEIKTVDLEDKTFIGFFHKTKIGDVEEMTKLFEADMPRARMYAMKNGLKYGEFVPASLYQKWDEKTQETEFYIGLLLHKDIKVGDGMKKMKIPAGRAAMVSKFGKYGNGDQKAHVAIDNYMKANNLKRVWPIWELYVNDPTTVKPHEVQTDIYYKIKK